MVHRRLSTHSPFSAACSVSVEDCRRPLRVQWFDTGSRQRCLGVHSDSSRSPWCGNFNGISRRLDQGPPPVMPRDCKVCQGHPVPVGQGCQTCSIGFTTFIPRQGIFYRRGVRSGALPPPRFARQTRAVEATLHPRSSSFVGPAVVGRISIFLARQRCAAVAFSTDTSDLDRCKFRARVRIDSAGASCSAKGLRGVDVGQQSPRWVQTDDFTASKSPYG